LTAFKGEIGTTGVVETIPYTGDVDYDLTLAVWEEHPCSDAGCDIREAVDHGYAQVAAALLQGATETPLLDTVLAYYRVDTHSPSNWTEWVEHFDTYARGCDSCGGFTFGDDWWTPSQCANCGADLPDQEEEDAAA
jgi:hypothetical protein